MMMRDMTVKVMNMLDDGALEDVKVRSSCGGASSYGFATPVIFFVSIYS